MTLFCLFQSMLIPAFDHGRLWTMPQFEQSLILLSPGVTSNHHTQRSGHDPEHPKESGMYLIHLPFQKTNHLGKSRQLVSHVHVQSKYHKHCKYAHPLSSPLRWSPQVCSKPQQIAENTSSSDFCSGTRTPAQHRAWPDATILYVV